jgi:toxin ParE1/3/4
MRRAFWTPDAKNDLAKIDDHLAGIDFEFAKRVGRLAIITSHYLADNPFVGPVIEPGTARKWPVRNTPYLLFYRPVKAGVEILRVRHAHEDWKPIL